MARRYQVFISATSDLKADREEAIKAVRACECDPCAMEDWTGSDAELKKAIERKLAGCDFMVLLVGASYGSKVPGLDRSWVQHEFIRARQLKIPVIPLVKQVASESHLRAPQKKFRDALRHTLLTKSYGETTDLAGYLSTSLLAMIRPKEQSILLETNADLISEVADYLNERRRRNSSPPKAILIQYSAQNARDIIRKLLWNGVKTDLYVADPNSTYTIPHQKAWIEQNLRQLPNHVDPLDSSSSAGQRKMVFERLRIFPYRAPGSLRVVALDKEFLAVGAFTYMMKRPVKGKDLLDVRGGELPMVLLRREHAGFDMMRRMVDSVIRNWHSHGVVPKTPRKLGDF